MVCLSIPIAFMRKYTDIGKGFLYSQKHDRMWRKNREVNNGSTCLGVDLNRHWPYMYVITASFPSSLDSQRYTIILSTYFDFQVGYRRRCIQNTML